ncbi:MAG: diguanylate cyclase [Chitinispirillaceae bacterium]|nr:diguanylate cyclase [Chitinispirillaceae bacterium]
MKQHPNASQNLLPRSFRARGVLGVAVALGTLIICHYLGGLAAAVGVPAAGAAAIALLMLLSGRRFSRKTRRSAAPPAPEPVLQHQAQQEVAASITGVRKEVLGAEFSSRRKAETAAAVVGMADGFVRCVHMKINANTVAVFIIHKIEGYELLCYKSESGAVIPGAVILPGQGVLGAFFKDGLKKLNLKEITNDSTTLFYYSDDVGIRSLIACPVMAAGAERGFMLADSTQQCAFTDEHLSFMETAASLFGQAAYYAHLNTENWIGHRRLAEVSNIEKDFFKNPTVASILESLSAIIPLAIPCDRMTISMRLEDADKAVIRRVCGICTEKLLDARFSLSEKSLAGILYARNLRLSRNFAADRYEVRYFEDEPRYDDFASFLAVPLGVDECIGMVLLESLHPDAFSETERNFLWRIITSAGLAMERILLLEKTNTMATHDGLTNLFNHRHFQKLLRDEITRSCRYSDPLALVIGDIDHFKKINDAYGHPFGDTVLRSVSRLLEESIRTGVDTAARYGGEEFALILVKTGEEQALETAERIRRSIEGKTLAGPSGGEVRVTMSFGIAVLGEHTREHDDLIKKADKALYRAKERGRNRVEIF